MTGPAPSGASTAPEQLVENLTAAVEQLPAADREILSFTLDVLHALIAAVNDHTACIRALDRLDDLRETEIGRLRELVEAYAPSSEPVPIALGDYCARCHEWIPSGEVHRSGHRPYHQTCYQAEVRELREQRDGGQDD